MEAITVCVLSYRREKKLLKLLESLNSQTYQNFRVIISNDDPDTNLKCLISEKYKYPIEYHIQTKNLGLINNYSFLLSKVQTEYMMWLADDDMISFNYLESNISNLLSNQIVCSVGQWVQVKNNGFFVENCHSVEQPHFSERLELFVEQWSDHFIYGVFKVSALMGVDFPRYLPPNNNKVENWCYVYLSRVLKEGGFMVDSKSSYFDNIETEKHYENVFDGKLALIKYLLLKLNVFGLIYLFNGKETFPFLFIKKMLSFIKK